MKPVIGMIGLGIMGGAMAEALIDAGYRVVGYDVNAKARQR
jgi:3-hydroxyisobutyrate dehydrogenase-like beta-hydroxyacid dehydrogenase